MVVLSQRYPLHASSKRRAYLGDLVAAQPSLPVPVTRSCPAAYGHFPLVLSVGAPAQVRQPVIRLVVVAVKAFQARRTQPDEGFKDKGVDVTLPHLAIPGQADFEVDALAGSLRTQNTPVVEALPCPPWHAADTSLITDLVETLIAGDVAPVLAHQRHRSGAR